MTFKKLQNILKHDNSGLKIQKLSFLTYLNVYKGGRATLYEILQKPQKTAKISAP